MDIPPPDSRPKPGLADLPEDPTERFALQRCPNCDGITSVPLSLAKSRCEILPVHLGCRPARGMKRARHRGTVATPHADLLFTFLRHGGCLGSYRRSGGASRYRRGAEESFRRETGTSVSGVDLVDRGPVPANRPSGTAPPRATTASGPMIATSISASVMSMSHVMLPAPGRARKGRGEIRPDQAVEIVGAGLPRDVR